MTEKTQKTILLYTTEPVDTNQTGSADPTLKDVRQKNRL